MSRIATIRAREILDSRGDPTVEVDVYLEDGAFGRALVPSGASRGMAEAWELRDGDRHRYNGRGVLKAVENVNVEIAAALLNHDAANQAGTDRCLCELDGTANKSRLGSNAILGVSLAAARAAASSRRLPLYRHLGGTAAVELPVPMVNIISGRIHGGGDIDFQDFMVLPLQANCFKDALQDVVAVYRAMKHVLQDHGIYQPGVADEGGYSPRLESNEVGFALMVEAIERAGLRPGQDAAIAVDIAASHFEHHGVYALAAEKVHVDSAGMVERLSCFIERYPILSIEDGLGEEDWKGWRDLTARLGSQAQLVGDDLFATNPARLRKGIRSRSANAVLVKMNQVGTLSETLEVIDIARRSDYRTVVSARSGETEDTSIADLAVATGASQIKIGAITRSERLAKYNQLLRIEEELGNAARYRGASIFNGLGRAPKTAGLSRILGSGSAMKTERRRELIL